MWRNRKNIVINKLTVYLKLLNLRNYPCDFYFFLHTFRQTVVLLIDQQASSLSLKTNSVKFREAVGMAGRCKLREATEAEDTHCWSTTWRWLWRPDPASTGTTTTCRTGSPALAPDRHTARWRQDRRNAAPPARSRCGPCHSRWPEARTSRCCRWWTDSGCSTCSLPLREITCARTHTHARTHIQSINDQRMYVWWTYSNIVVITRWHS